MKKIIILSFFLSSLLLGPGTLVAATTKVCPCPSETGQDALCQYTDADSSYNEYNSSACQTPAEANGNGYTFSCGTDTSGLAKLCKTAPNPDPVVSTKPDGTKPTAPSTDNKPLSQTKPTLPDQNVPCTDSECPRSPGNPGPIPDSTKPTNQNSPATTGIFGTTCSGSGVTIKSLIGCLVTEIINPLVYVIIGLALITFLNGLFNYLKGGDKPADRQKGREFMFWGIIALAIMISVWGLVNIVVGTFFTGGTSGLPTAPVLPTVKYNQ